MAILKIPGQKIEFALTAKIPEIVRSIRSPVLSVKETNASSRMMNYYIRNSLLLTEQGTKGKERLNLTQVLWIFILKELLKANIQPRIILRLKEDCETFQFYDYNSFNSYAQLEFIAALIIEYKSDIRLIVLPDGSYTFINFSIASNLYRDSYFLSNTHVSIPLFDRIQAAWKKVSQEDIQKRKVIFKEIKPDEETVLDALQTVKGSVDEIVIHLKRQEVPQSILVHEKIDTKTIDSICKFLRDCRHCKVEIGYGDISGEAVYLKKSRTIKLPK